MSLNALDVMKEWKLLGSTTGTGTIPINTSGYTDVWVRMWYGGVSTSTFVPVCELSSTELIFEVSYFASANFRIGIKNNAARIANIAQYANVAQLYVYAR